MMSGDTDGTVTFRLNGSARRLATAPDRALLDILRETFGLMAVKPGCAIGRCGTCLVLLDAQPVNACLIMAYQLEGTAVVSPEGLDQWPEAQVLRESLIAENSFQCGYCAPGFTIALVALLRRNPDADAAEIRSALAGNLCRCSGYQSIIRGALEAVKRLGEARPAAVPVAHYPPAGSEVALSFRTERSGDPEPGSLGGRGRQTRVPDSASPPRNEDASDR